MRCGPGPGVRADRRRRPGRGRGRGVGLRRGRERPSRHSRGRRSRRDRRGGGSARCRRRNPHCTGGSRAREPPNRLRRGESADCHGVSHDRRRRPRRARGLTRVLSSGSLGRGGPRGPEEVGNDAAST